MKLKILFAATVAFAAFPAHAQDTDNGNAAFTGPRIQAQVGWDRVAINIEDTRNFGGRGDFITGPSDQDSEISFGGEIGFDADLGGFVIGAYAGADFSDAAEGFNFDAATPPQPRLLLEADRNYYVGARVGFVAGGRALIYGKGGFSRATLDESNPSGVARTINFNNDDDEIDGYHFGGGVELALTEMLYVRADYTHTRYDSSDLPLQPTPAQTLELNFNRNQVTGAIGIRF